MSKNKNQSITKIKTMTRSSREEIKQNKRRSLQQARMQQEREQARAQIQRLKETGLVSAYEQFLRSICKNGLPEPANVYQLAAQFMLKFEKKHKSKLQKKQELERQNKDLLQSSFNYQTMDHLSQRK